MECWNIIKAVSYTHLDGKDIIQSADLIVLAIYPNLVKDFIIKNKEYFKDGTIITDVTGIKQLFINEIIEILPDKIDFVFAHPMAGREKKGIERCIRDRE